MKNSDRKIGLSIIVVLLILSNIAGIYKILAGTESLAKTYSLFDPSSIKLLVLIPVVTIVSLFFIWFGKKLGIILAIPLYLIVIILDLYYQVWPHAILATTAFILLMFFCWQSRKYFSTTLTQT